MFIVLHNHKVFVWGIPPLSPHPPDFLDDNPTHIPPLLKTSLPDDITRKHKHIRWEMILDWYTEPSQSIHLGVSTRLLNLHNVEIVIKPDLSDISLYVTNTFRLAPEFWTILCSQSHIFEDHTHVSEPHIIDKDEGRIHMRSTSSRPPNILPESPISLKLSLPRVYRLSSCPASGRLVYSVDENYCHDYIVVADFLKYDV